MDDELNTNTDFNGRSLPCEIDMDDDNTPILENKSVGEYNCIRGNSLVGEITLDPVQLNDHNACMYVLNYSKYYTSIQINEI